MAATLRELRGRIRSAGSIKKITKAQELIATSRIGKAQAWLDRPIGAGRQQREHRRYGQQGSTREAETAHGHFMP